MIELTAIADGVTYRVQIDDAGDPDLVWDAAAQSLRERIEEDRRLRQTVDNVWQRGLMRRLRERRKRISQMFLT